MDRPTASSRPTQGATSSSTAAETQFIFFAWAAVALAKLLSFLGDVLDEVANDFFRTLPLLALIGGITLSN